MTTVTIAQATEQIAALIEAAQQGETVTITRDGHPVVVLCAAPLASPTASHLSIDWLQQQLARFPTSDENAEDIVRSMREETDH
jgi:prevent-host-death family protein